MDSPFTKIVEFAPAFDKRSNDPTKNYGIHGVTLRMVLTGPKGAVHFLLYTNWQLPHVTEEKKRFPYEPIGGDPHWMERPIPVDLGYHSPVPRFEEQSGRPDCPYLAGAMCYGDGSALAAETVYHRLLAEGSDGVWDALTDYYIRTFEDGAEDGFISKMQALIKNLGIA